jgi:colicin import membrane protein
MNGVVETVNLQSCDIGDSAKAKSFRDSIERAVYKASPLPTAPDESVFDREVFFDFRVN